VFRQLGSDRLHSLTRLILNQIVRTLTTSLDYKDSRTVSANEHPLLLVLDEFPMLGRLEILAEALSLIAGYGIRACLVAQDLSQIYDKYGGREEIFAQGLRCQWSRQLSICQRQ
jgi:type IV secretion system protein VirD4